MSICKMNQPQRWVCRTSKSDLSSTIQCSQIYISGNCKFGYTKAGAEYEHLLNEPTPEVSLLNIEGRLK